MNSLDKVGALTRQTHPRVWYGDLLPVKRTHACGMETSYPSNAPTRVVIQTSIHSERLNEVHAGGVFNLINWFGGLEASVFLWFGGLEASVFLWWVGDFCSNTPNLKYRGGRPNRVYMAIYCLGGLNPIN